MSKNAKTTKARNSRNRKPTPEKAEAPAVDLAEVLEPQAEAPAPETPAEAEAPAIDTKAKVAETLAWLREAQAAHRDAKLADRAADKAAARAARPKGMGCLEAAYIVLLDFPHGLDAKAIIRRMSDRELWKSPAGLTPWATIYAGITREISAKGPSARFARGEKKGLFIANPLLAENA